MDIDLLLLLMTFVSASQFHVYLMCSGACLALNVKVLVGTFNQEKALIGDTCETSPKVR